MFYKGIIYEGAFTKVVNSQPHFAIFLFTLQGPKPHLEQMDALERPKKEWETEKEMALKVQEERLTQLAAAKQR